MNNIYEHWLEDDALNRSLQAIIDSLSCISDELNELNSKPLHIEQGDELC